MHQLTNAQRQQLRRLANQLRPVVQIGKQGLTDSVRISVDQALAAHELVKVKFLTMQDEKGAVATDLTRSTESMLIALVGNVAILYREQPDPDKRSIHLAS